MGADSEFDNGEFTWIGRMDRMKRYKCLPPYGPYLWCPPGDLVHPGYRCPKFLRGQ
jgi:hypothetical protein